MLKDRKNVKKFKAIILVLISMIIILGFYIKAIAIDLGNGTINPIYRPIWKKISSSLNTEDQEVYIFIEGTATMDDLQIDANTTIKYASTLTSNLTKNDITVYVDGEEAGSIKRTLSTGTYYKSDGTVTTNTAEAVKVQHILTLSDFEQTSRQMGKNFLEWSGNISIKIGGRGQSDTTYTAKKLVDQYGNQSMMELDSTGAWVSITYQDANTDHNTNGTMFADFIKPEFTYAYSSTNPDINTGTETVTVVFDVTDKHFASTQLATDTTGSLITVIVDDDENANTPITKVLTKIKDVYYDKTEGTTYVELDATGTGTKVGERYQLEITGLDQEDGFSYSGPMTLSFQEGVITDKSENISAQKSITMGVNEPDGDPDDEIIVDVVDPVWEVQNVEVTPPDANGNVSASMTLIGTDKYFKESTLTVDDIQIKVDGVTDITSTAPDLVKTLSEEPVYIKLDASGDYVETTSSDPDVIGVKYTFTMSGFKETDNTFFANRADYNNDPATGRLYREYSGEVTIVIPSGKLEDETGNVNNKFEIPLDHVDTLRPEVIKVEVEDPYDINETNVELSTYTVVFDIVDKYIYSSSITTTDTSKIHVFLDGEAADSITKTITKIDPLTDSVNGSSRTVGYRYTLELSGFENARTSIDYDRLYTDWSGALSIKIDANTATDTSGTGNAETILYGNESETTDKTKAAHVDFIKPDATYKYLEADVDTTNKKFTMVFEITDKFYDQDIDLTDIEMIMSAEEEETGEGEDGYYNLMDIPIIRDNLSLQMEEVKNQVVVDVVNGTPVKEERVIGKRYTLVINHLEQVQKIENNYYLDYSGSITITIPQNTVEDSSGNGNDITTITSGIDIPGGAVVNISEVDVVDPIWEGSFTTDIHGQSATMTVEGTDKYFYEHDDTTITDDDGYGTLTFDEIKLIVDGTEATGSVSEGIKTFVDASGNVLGKLSMREEDKLTEQRIVETEYGDGDVDTGYTTEIVQYGIQYTLTFTELPIDKHQIKVQFTEGALIDYSGNKSNVRDFLIYNTLKTATDTSGNWEDTATSGFLGNATIQRQNIDEIVFVSSLNDAPAIDGATCWDVSARTDNSILAWTTQTTEQAAKGVYTVNIGSNDTIYGNINSSFLFSYIGYSTSCTETETIKNLNLLRTENVTNMRGMFQYCGYNAMSSLILPTSFDTKNVTDMSEMFNNCGYTAMENLTLSSTFDTTKVTTMYRMFRKAGYTAMTTFQLGSNFNTENVENMGDMFAECAKTSSLLQSVNLGSKFDTGKVTDMQSMFYNFGYSGITSLDLGDKFNTENVTNMKNMFYGMQKLTTLKLGDKFNTRNVENMEHMFAYLYQMEYLDLGDKFYTTSATNMNRMFRLSSKLKVLDLGPAFTRIPDGNITYSGSSIEAYTKMLALYDGERTECIIYAPESIYNDRTHFKANTDSTTTIEFSNGTIIPMYRPEWEKVSTSVDTTNKEITVTFKGYANKTFTNGTYTGSYSSPIKSLLETGNDASNLLVVKVDGEVAEEITQTVTEVSVTENEVQYTIKLSGFQETTRQNGKYKNFLEWSGNIAIQPKKGTLIDKYGSYLKTETQTDEDGNNVEVQVPVTNVFSDESGNYIGNKNMTSIDYTLDNSTNTVNNPYVSDDKWYDIEFRDATQTGSTSSTTSGNWTDTISANTTGKMFTDYIKPEFTYESVNVDSETNPDINYTTNTITVVFDVTDKYFASTQLATDTTGSLITVIVDEDADANTVITKQLTKLQDLYYTVNGVTTHKVGERYQLVITGLETSHGHGYSGPLTLSFPADIIVDQSNNKSDLKTITMGINEPSNPDYDDETIVDVVNPIWSYATSDIDRTNNQVNIYIVGSDKYYSSNSLIDDINDITVYVDNSSTTVDTDRDETPDGDVTTIVKTLNPITDADQIATLATQAGLSNEITNNLTNVGVVYKLTLSNFGTISGETKVVLPAGTLVDESNNQNTETTINVGNVTWIEPNVDIDPNTDGIQLDDSTNPRYPAFRNNIVDFLIPRIKYTYSTVDGAENPDVDYEQKKVTVKFTVTDKYLLESDLIKKDAEGNLTTLPKNMKIKVDGITVYDSALETQQYQVIASITESNIANGKEYTLVVSNIQQELDAPPTNTTPTTPGTKFGDGFNFSGTMQVEFTAGVIDDTSGNKNIATTITLDTEYSDIVDVVDPIIKYNSSSIDKVNNTVTLNVLAEDKYISQGLLAENADEVIVKVQKPNGVVVEDTTTITKQITRTNRLQTSMTYQIILSGFGLNEGITSVIIPKDMILDTSGNGNIETEIFVGNADGPGAFKDSVVDFTEPVWNYDTSSIDRDRYTNGIAHNQTGTVTLDIVGTDIYFDETRSKQLETSDIKVYVNGVENTTITKTLATNADGSIFKESVTETDANGDIQKGVRYRLILSNFGTNEGAVKIEVDDDVIRDTSWNGDGNPPYNANIATQIDVGNVTWIEPDVDIDPNTDGIQPDDSTNPKYDAFRSDIVDFINPVVTYTYEDGVNPLIDRTEEEVHIKFNVTDTNFLESNIGTEDITIFVDGIDVTGVLTKSLASAAITDGSGNGITYTLTLSQFELENILEGDIYKKHSGAIKLVIASGQVEDTSGNKNVETTLFIDYEDGTEAENGILNQYEDLDGDDVLDATEDEEGVIVDFVDPVIYYHSQYINWSDRYAEITLRATDRFYDSSVSTLSPSDITLYELNNAGQWIQVTDFTDGKTTITSSANGYGKDFTIKLSDFEEEFKLKVNIPAGKIGDTSGNYNQLTEIEVTLDNKKPRWQYVSADTTAFESTGTINFNVKGVDKFLDLTNSALDVSDLKVLLDGEDITNADNITLSTPVDDTTEKSKAYTISVSGLTTIGTYTLVFAEETLIDEFGNESAATTINFSKSAISVNTGNYVNVTYYVSPDNEMVHHSFAHELMSVNTTGTNLENTTYRPSTLGELHNDGENPLFAEPAGQSFAGWAEADEDGNIIYYTSSDYTEISTTKTTYFKVHGLYDEIPNTVVHLKSVWQDATVIYVSSTGNNSNDGTTPTTPVADLTTAFSKLNTSGTAENNIIVIMDAVEWNSSTTLTNSATITSLYAGVDYRTTQNAELKISSNMTINKDIIFDNIELYADSTTVSDGTDYLANGTYTNMLIANYADITLGRRVTTPDGKYTFGAIVGGNYKTESTTGTIGTHTVRVEAGRYNNIIAGSAVDSDTAAKARAVTEHLVIGNMRDAAVSRNDKLTITGYVSIGELMYSYNSSEQCYSSAILYSGTFTGENTFAIGAGDVAIYMRSLNMINLGYKILAKFEMFGGIVDGNIYGGGTVSNIGVVGDNELRFYGGKVNGNIFGQGLNYDFKGETSIYLTGKIEVIGNVFGGSNVTEAGAGNGEGNIEINVESSSATVSGYIYGGSNGLDNDGFIDGNIDIYVSAGTLNNIYGSGKNAGNSGYSQIWIENGIISGNLVGGAYNGQASETYVLVDAGTINGDIYCGNENTTQEQLDNDTTLQNGEIYIGWYEYDYRPTINGNIYGGGKFDKSGTVDIHLMKSQNITSVFGGSDVNCTVETANIYLHGMTVDTIYGGGKETGTVENANIYLETGTATDVYGGGYGANVECSTIILGEVEDPYDEVTGGTATVTNIYGGSNSSGTATGEVTTSNITLTSGTVTNVFGGGNSSNTGTANVTLNGITIDTIYGGSKDAGTTNTTNVTLTSGTVNTVFGGGLDSTVGTSNIHHNAGATVTTIYGGNNSGAGDGGSVGTANVNVVNSEVENIYGGNYLKGTTTNTNINIQGTSEVTGELYGGGNQSNIAQSGTTGSATINITGGTIEGDINGGSKQGIVYGTTNINIGKDAVEDSTLVAGNISIAGNIYGAGSSTLAPNRDTAKVITNYNYDYVSVVGDTHIKMDNSATSPITFGGSIFGAGNGATYNNGGASDNSTIHLKDFGTSASAHQMVSIERTGRLFIGNSFVELLGRQDINNYYKKTSYTINRIARGLTVHDNTTLYTRRGFNMVGGFNSYISISEVTGNGTKAAVTITGGAIGTKNVDNRLYTLEGINLIFSKEEAPVPTSTNWGEVNGMTFFGMYEVSSTGNKVYDIYNPDVYNSSYTGTLVEKYFANGTYIEGLHEASHNVGIDGFYTVEADYDAGTVAATVIQPTPASATYYDWLIGADKVTYNLSLIGSISGKESVAELLLDYNYLPNATYTFDRVSLNALNLGVNLVEPSSIGVISANANNTFGLTIETDNAGWRNQATTSIFSTDSDTTYNNGSFVGDTIYKTDNTATPGTIKFKLHNSINITEKQDLGNVNLILTGKTTVDGDPSQGNTFIIVIAVNLQTELETQVEEYIPTFTNNQHTELNYTTDSRVDLSYVFYKEMDTTPYASGDYRVISTTTQLPSGTTLTLKDYAQGTSPKYYYYHVTDSTAYTTETVDGVMRYVYKLSDFFEMSSTTVKYEDSTSYYNSTDKYALEKYDVSIDFGNANISADKLAQETYLELKDSSGASKYSNGNTEITYNLYYNKNAVMTHTISNEDEVYSVIEDTEVTFTLTASLLEQLTAGGDRIMDTKYYDQIAGIAIEIVDENGIRIKHPDVQNLKLVNVNDATEQYIADENSVIRVPFIEGVGATSGEYKLSMSQNSVPPGTYSVKVHFFSSDDGMHYGDEAKVEKEFFAIFVSKLLGMIGVEATDDSRIISATTGENLEGNTGIDMTISIGDAMAQTNIRAQLYKRTTTYDANGNYTGTTYTLVNLTDYLQGTWETPEDHGLISAENYEYIVWVLEEEEEEETEPATTAEIETVELERALKEGVTTGEYKLVIESYYENTLVQTVRKTFIVTE